MMKKILLVLVLGSLFLSLVACGSRPATMRDLPVYPGAEPLEPEEQTLAGKVLAAMQESAAEHELTASFALYTLPADTTWEDILAFYTDRLAGTDWKPAPDLENDSEDFKGVGWSRGSGSDEQSLVVNYVPQVLTQDSFLLVGLFSR